MSWESGFKVGLSALPTSFTVLGVWLYWHENPLPMLASNIAFWGVVIAFYLFTQLYLPHSRSPFYLAAFTACIWLLVSITSHNLARFLASGRYMGWKSLLTNIDLWYSYLFAGLGLGVPMRLFIRHEPRIVAEVERQRGAI